MIESRAAYEAKERWHIARRRFIGDRSKARPAGTIHLGSKITPAFLADLELLGWRAACVLDEENGR